jgi:hypothetical protein
MHIVFTERILAALLFPSKFAPLGFVYVLFMRLNCCVQGVVARSRWAHSTVDDLFTKQLPHNATWALTLLYALQRDESAWMDASAQVHPPLHGREPIASSLPKNRYIL